MHKRMTIQKKHLHDIDRYDIIRVLNSLRNEIMVSLMLE